MSGFRYRTSTPVPYEAVADCRLRASAFARFRDFSPGEAQSGFFWHRGALPHLMQTGGIQLVETTVIGHLPTKGEPWATFLSVLDRGVAVGSLGTLRVWCGFEERTSRQTKRAYDVAGITVSLGRVHFEYFASGSNVSAGGPYTREFMARLVQRLQLPLVIRDVDDHFRLEHASSGGLRLGSTLAMTDWDPTGFSVEIPGGSPTGELDRLRRCLELCATSRRFAHQWIAGRERGGHSTTDPDLSERIYAELAAAALPAERYEVQLEFTLSDLSGIDAIRRMCGPQDVVFTRVCSFDLPDDNWGEITAATTAAGHRLNLELRRPDALPVVQQHLGVAFVADE